MNNYPVISAAVAKASAAVYSGIVSTLQECKAAGATIEGPFHDEFVITVPDDKREAVEAILARGIAPVSRGEVRYA